MKKNYMLLALMFGAFSAGAQSVPQTIGFDSYTLGVDTFDNQANNQGYFEFDGIRFENYYDVTYDYNTGFSITNKQNDTTGDYTNGHSAITASGYNSSIYSMFYGSGAIDLNGLTRGIEGLYVSNGTYAYFSMLNGDAYGKKFGDTVNASGVSDGTNGEDFFKVIFTGISTTGDTIAQVEYFLADYRFADDAQDYIVDDWDYVDLTSLNGTTGTLAKIGIGFESSDVGMFGMNTPAYVAIDDVRILAPASLAETELKLAAYPNPMQDELVIPGNFDLVQLISINGQIIKEIHQANNAVLNVADLKPGAYILQAVSASQTAQIQLLK